MHTALCAAWLCVCVSPAWDLCCGEISSAAWSYPLDFLLVPCSTTVLVELFWIDWLVGKLGVLPVLSVLGVLTLGSPVDRMARVWLWKVYICPPPCLSGRQQGLVILVTLPGCVCAGGHAHCLVSCLCGSWLGLGPFGGSARLILIISSQLLIFLLTCQVAMPLGIILCLFHVCAGNNEMIRMKIKIIWIKPFKKIILCSLGHFINL
jgi:hypothetical protein